MVEFGGVILTFFERSNLDKAKVLIVVSRKIAVAEIKAIRAAVWVGAVESQREIAKAKASVQLTDRLIKELNEPDLEMSGPVREAWEAKASLVLDWMALTLLHTKAKDLRISKLAKLEAGWLRDRKELVSLAADSNPAKADGRAQEIIGNTSLAASFVEALREDPRLFQKLGSMVWNKTLGKTALKAFGKSIGNLNRSDTAKLSDWIAGKLLESRGFSELVMRRLRTKRPEMIEKLRAEILSEDLAAEKVIGEIFDDDLVPDDRLVRQWTRRSLSEAAAVVSLAMVALDVVTVIIDTVDDSKHWASTFAGSAAAAWAASGTGVAMEASLSELGATSTLGFQGAEAMELSVLQNTLDAIATEAVTFFSAGADAVEVPPVAAFIVITGIAVIAATAVAALVDTVVELFFGPSGIPAGLRAQFSAPVAAPVHAVNVAAISAPRSAV